MKKARPLMRALVVVLLAISALMSTATRAYAYDATGQSGLARPAAAGGSLIAIADSLRPMLTGTSPLVSALAAEGSEGLWAGGRATANALGGTQSYVAIAGDARLGGNAAVALRTDAQLISVIEDTLGGSFGAVSGEAEITAILENAGFGARGIVFGDRGVGEVGHVWNAVNQGGTIRFIDFQSGRAASFSGYKGFEFLLTAGGG